MADADRMLVEPLGGIIVACPSSTVGQVLKYLRFTRVRCSVRQGLGTDTGAGLLSQPSQRTQRANIAQIGSMLEEPLRDITAQLASHAMVTCVEGLSVKPSGSVLVADFLSHPRQFQERTRVTSIDCVSNYVMLSPRCDSC